MKNLLKNGLIEPSTNNQFNSSVFLVSKKDATKRMVIDQRSINDKIIPFNLELPGITDMINGMAAEEGEYYSSCGFNKSLSPN